MILVFVCVQRFAIFSLDNRTISKFKRKMASSFHWIGIGGYCQPYEPPESNISLIRVSIGVFPTNLTKNNCSIIPALTVRKDGRRSRSFPNLVGWFGYCVLTYSSNAHWDFSCTLSICAASFNPWASENEYQIQYSGNTTELPAILAVWYYKVELKFEQNINPCCCCHSDLS